MATVDTDPGALIYEFPVATVESKDTLDDANWTAVPNLYCDKLTLAVNAYDEAQLAFEIGNVLQVGTAIFDDYEPLSMLGKFVRITLPQDAPTDDLVWVGYVVSTANQQEAVKTDGPDKKIQGRTQILTAVGLEYFLDRRQIDSAVIAGSPTTTILRSMPFNGGLGVSLDPDTSNRANRNPTTDADGYQFVEQGETPELWTTGQAVSYLLNYFSTVDSANAKLPTEFILDPQDALDAMLDGPCPTLDPEGMTVHQCLNKLLAPQRGFVWWTEFDNPFPGSHHVRIRVETIATSIITLPSLGTIPANRDQQSLDLEQQRDVQDLVRTEFGSRIYHQIIARGARMTSTVTFGFTDELIMDWTSTVETSYDTGVSGTGAENDAYRRAERFYRVYTTLRLDPAWDGKSGDGAAGARNWSFPELSPTGSIVASLPFNVKGLRLLNYTRLKRSWNYADVDAIDITTPTDTEAEYMQTFAIIQVASASGGDPDRFQFADKMGDSDFDGASAPESGNIQTSYHLSIQQNVPGIVLRPTNGTNHCLALNHFAGAGATEHDPEVDYETVRVTCTIEADAYCEARWPADASLPANVPLQKLILYVGDEYRLDFLAENTVVDLNNGEPVLTNGGVLRDDRAHLNDIARVAYEWYRQERYPVTITFRNLINVFRLGMLVTTIGSGTAQQNVNTVVSTITYDMKDGLTTIQTSDQDLDLVAVT